MDCIKRATCRLAGALTMTLAALGCSRDARTEVVIYAAVDRGQAEPILARFEEQHGARVRALYDAESAKTTGLVTRLQAESAQPRCDVFWNNELAQTLLLANRGMLQSYDSPAAAGIPSTHKDDDHRWTALAQRARVIVYNTRLVPSGEVPRSIFDLTKPKWRGKVAVANPQFGTTRTHVAALFAALGPQRAQDWLQGLMDNEVRIVDGNAMVKGLVARAHPDASPVLVGLTDTDDVLAGQAEGEPVDMVFPDQDSLGTLVIPCSVCLVRGGPHADIGRKLIDFLLSPQTEALLTGSKSGYFPVREGASKTSTFPVDGVHGMDVTFQDIFKQLEPSSRWAQENFHP